MDMFKTKRMPVNCHSNRLNMDHTQNLETALTRKQQHPTKDAGQKEPPRDVAQRPDSHDTREEDCRKFVFTVIIEVFYMYKYRKTWLVYDKELCNFVTRVTAETLKRLPEDLVVKLDIRTALKSVYSELQRKYGKNMKYLICLQDPAVMINLADIIGEKIIKKNSKGLKICDDIMAFVVCVIVVPLSFYISFSQMGSCT